MKRTILVVGMAVALVGVVAMVRFDTDPSQAQEKSRLTHPAIAEPATLSDARAEALYQAIRGQMRDVYLASGDPVMLGYQNWTRYNRHRYRSPNHGERFVNHYGNGLAAAYGNFEEGGPLPEGAIVIKDSFTVTKSGVVMTGPMFMMEKMPAGFPSGAGSWRFIMLDGDGNLVGMTDGDGDEKVRFCGTCHRNAGPEQDYLFFLPEEARVAPN